MSVTRDTWLEVAFALQLSLGSVGLAGGHLAASGLMAPGLTLLSPPHFSYPRLLLLI